MTRTLAIGDIHGCHTALDTICNAVNLRSDDTIVTLGDYVNRGPDSKSVIETLIELSRFHQLKPLRGNHEIMMLQSKDNEAEFLRFLRVGGDETLRSYKADINSDLIDDLNSDASIPAEHWDFLEHELLPFFESETHFFVHANAYPDVPLSAQPDYMLYWESFNDPALHESGKIMVCGHSSQKTGLPLTNGNAVCIDTWACGTGWLSCLHVESGQIWQSNEGGENRKLWLDEL